MKLIKRQEAKEILKVGDVNFYEIVKCFPTMQVRRGLFDESVVIDVSNTLTKHFQKCKSIKSFFNPNK